MKTRAHGSSASHRSGFTLVELAIVIVIIGLVVGAITAGEEVINNQRLRTVGTDAAKYMIALNQFKQQYGYLPGDFPNATAVWGRADAGSPVTSNCAAPNTTAAVGNTTCNGDGDGVITATWTAATPNHEAFRAWQHLSAAGLISGTYTGIGGAAPYCVLGTNVPKSTMEGMGFNWQTGSSSVNLINNNVTASAQYYDGDYTNALLFGALRSLPAAAPAPIRSVVDGIAFTPTQQAGLDAKLDDGLPATGNIRSAKPTAPWTNCAVGTTSAATYKVSYTNAACSPIFMNTFKTKN